jgi:PIN domain nuclease of toxin-antitoxin system
MSSNRYLLDTNILVFFIGDKSRLSKKIISILSDSANLLYTSSLCVAELSHLRKTGKVKLADKSIFKLLEENGIEVMYVNKNDLKSYEKLETSSDKNKDPIDHQIVAHAISSKMSLISSDRLLSYYTKQGLNLVENF